jgi:hypothetical protein
MEENRIPKKSIIYKFGNNKLRGRPRNRWQDEVREDGIIVGGEEWQEKLYNREEWKKLLRTARNRHILHIRMECLKSPFMEMIYECNGVYIFIQVNELGKLRRQLEVSGRIPTSSLEEDEEDDAEDMWLEQDSSYMASGRTICRSKAG